MNYDIKNLIGEITEEEKNELKRLRMEILKNALKDELGVSDKVHSNNVSTLSENNSKNRFEKVYLYIPLDFKRRIEELKKEEKKPITAIVRNYLDKFLKEEVDSFRELLEKYKKYYKDNSEKKENLACSIDISNFERISTLAEVRPRWIVEAILFHRINK